MLWSLTNAAQGLSPSTGMPDRTLLLGQTNGIPVSTHSMLQIVVMVNHCNRNKLKTFKTPMY